MVDSCCLTTRCRCVGGEGGGGVAGSCWLHCRLRMVGSRYLDFRLKLCRTGGGGGGGGGAEWGGGFVQVSL